MGHTSIPPSKSSLLSLYHLCGVFVCENPVTLPNTEHSSVLTLSLTHIQIQRTLVFLSSPLCTILTSSSSPPRFCYSHLVMSAFVFGLLVLSMAGHSNAAWCACKGLSDAVLQKTLDYACGAGADCNPIHLNGPCFNPNSVRAHCNFAVNSYFQKKGQAAGACDFSGTATVTATDPSTAGCVYPATASSTTPTTTGSTITATTGGSPYVTNPGVLGGVNNGLGPSGAGMNTDISHGGISLQKANLFSFITITIVISALAFF